MGHIWRWQKAVADESVTEKATPPLETPKAENPKPVLNSPIVKYAIINIEKDKRKKIKANYDKAGSYTPNHTFNIPSVVRDEIIKCFVCQNTSDMFEHIFARGIKYYIEHPTMAIEYSDGYFGVLDVEYTPQTMNGNFVVNIYGRGSRKDITPMTFSISKPLWDIFTSKIGYQNKGVAFNHLLTRGLIEYKKAGTTAFVEFTDGVAGVQF
jgi:hypothetical protein